MLIRRAQHHGYFTSAPVPVIGCRLGSAYFGHTLLSSSPPLGAVIELSTGLSVRILVILRPPSPSASGVCLRLLAGPVRSLAGTMNDRLFCSLCLVCVVERPWFRSNEDMRCPEVGITLTSLSWHQFSDLRSFR